MNPIQRIIDFASGPIELPPAVRADALRLLADTLAVGAAGAASAEAEPIARAVVGWGAGTEARSLAGGTLPVLRRLSSMHFPFIALNGMRCMSRQWYTPCPW